MHIEDVNIDEYYYTNNNAISWAEWVNSIIRAKWDVIDNTCLFVYMLGRDQFKSLVVKMYRGYVQEDSSLLSNSKASVQDKKINMEDPQQVNLT